MTPDPGILTTLLNAFVGVFAAGPGHLLPAAERLLFLLGSLELTLAALWWTLKGENVAVGLLQKTLLIGLFTFFVLSWPTLVNTVLDGFVWSGFTAAGSSPAAGAALIKDPSAIISQAFVTIQPIEARINGLSWYQLGSLALYGWAFIATILAFFLLAIQIFVTYLEFYLVAALSLILVPFGVFKHTAFIAERALGSVVSFGVKLMVLSFILAAAQPVLAAIALPASPTLEQAYMVLLAAMAVCFLAWHAPGIAAGMLAGAPSLTAGSAAGFASASAFGALSSAAATSGFLRAGAAASLSATRSAAGLLGTATSGARLGAAMAEVGGSGVVGQVAAGGVNAGRALIRSGIAAGSAPVRAAGASIAESFKFGEVRAWNPHATNSTNTAAGASANRARGSTIEGVQRASRFAQTLRSAIPPEGAGGAGVSAPIRPPT